MVILNKNLGVRVGIIKCSYRAAIGIDWIITLFHKSVPVWRDLAKNLVDNFINKNPVWFYTTLKNETKYLIYSIFEKSTYNLAKPVMVIYHR